MIEKAKIKVVKRAEANSAKSRKGKPAKPRNAAREMVSTVTEWVSEVKQRKSEETRAALDLLFSTNRQPNES